MSVRHEFRELSYIAFQDRGLKRSKYLHVSFCDVMWSKPSSFID